MKMKKTTIFINCLALIIVLFVSQFCNITPKYLLSGNMLLLFNAAKLLLNAFMLMLFYLLMIACFVKNKPLYSLKELCKEYKWKKLLLLLAVVFIFEILSHIASYFVREYFYIVIHILTVLKWLAIYTVFTRKQETCIWRDRKNTSITAVIFVIALGLSVVFDLVIIAQNPLIFEVNLNLYGYLEQMEASQKLDGLFSACSTLLNILLSVTLYFLHIRSIKE